MTCPNCGKEITNGGRLCKRGRHRGKILCTEKVQCFNRMVSKRYTAESVVMRAERERALRSRRCACGRALTVDEALNDVSMCEPCWNKWVEQHRIAHNKPLVRRELDRGQIRLLRNIGGKVRHSFHRENCV